MSALVWALPAAFFLLTLLLPILLFYFLRRRYRQYPVGSLFLWDLVVQRDEKGRRLRWKSILLLLLQMALVVLAVLSLAGPVWTQGEEVHGTIYLLDTSASMGAGHRLSDAEDLILKDAQRLDPRTRLSLFVCSFRALPVGKDFRAGDSVGLRSALQGLEAGEGAFDEEAVSRDVQTWMAAQKKEGWNAVLVSDGGLSLGGQKLKDVLSGRLRFLGVGGSAEDLGVTGLRLLPTGSGTTRVEFLVQNGFKDVRSVKLTLEKDSRIIARAEVSAEPGMSRRSFEAPLAPGEGAYTLSLVDSGDAFALDDRCYLAVDAPRRLRILVAGEPNPFLKALLARDGVDYTLTDRLDSHQDWKAWDLVIADRVEVPPQIPVHLLTFSSVPAGAPLQNSGLVSGVLENSAPEHPLGRYVDWEKTQVGAAHAFDFPPDSGVKTLARVAGRPVVVTWDEAGYHRIVFGSDLFSSTIGMAGAFPVFIANLFQYCVPQANNPLASNLTVGVPSLRAVNAEEGGGGLSAGLETSRKGPFVELTASKTGFFSWRSKEGEQVIAANLPSEELDLEPRALNFPSTDATTSQRVLEEVPLALWFLFPALAILFAEWFFWRGGVWPGRGKTRILFVLRAAAAAALLLALFDPRLGLPTQDQSLVALLDLSRSLDAPQREAERQSLQTLVSALAPGDKIALVGFAAHPTLLADFESPAQTLSLLQRLPLSLPPDESTDLRAALALGDHLLSETQARGVRRLVLFSDGRGTSGAPATDFRSTSTLFALPFGQKSLALSSPGLELPQSANPGERVLATWKVNSPRAVVVDTALLVDGKTLLTRRFSLNPGENSFAFDLTAGQEGGHRIEIEARESGHKVDAASAQALLRVGSRPRVVVVNTGGDSPLAAALRTQGMNAAAVQPPDLPETPEGYAGLSAVVLDDVSALEFSDAQTAGLQNYVAGGGGLLVVGGLHSYGRGDYYATALEDLLPVTTDTRQRLFFSRSKILFILDHSGSMSEEVGNTTKLKAALQGLVSAVKELSPQDEVGILTFDSNATWLVPFTSASHQKSILAALSDIPDGGGTDIGEALQEAVAGFEKVGPSKRHVILLTDGDSVVGKISFQDLAQKLDSLNVSITTIGIGDEINEKLLKDLADWGKGNFYRAEAAELPRILTKETIRVTRDLLQEGVFHPAAAEGQNQLAGLQGLGRPVGGYLITRAKPQSEVAWAVPISGGKNDPLLATWRYGNGTVTSFTSDSGVRWFHSWAGTADYNRLWSQLVRNLQRPNAGEGLSVAVRAEASTAYITAQAKGPDRGVRTGLSLTGTDEKGTAFTLRETAPGFYSGELPLDHFGLKEFEVRTGLGGERASYWLWVPPGAEITQTGPDYEFLGKLALDNGGAVIFPSKPLLPPPGWGWSTTPLQGFLLILTLLVFIVELGLRSTQLGQGRRGWETLKTWWAAQQPAPDAQEISLPPPRQRPSTSGSDRDETRVRNAYRYLAQRTREREKRKP